MTPPDTADPYAHIPVLYDLELGDAAGDIAGYAARGVPGPLLVLGCGTGRVCRGLAPLRPVVGLDRSAPMLARARERGPASVRWVLGDMREFDVGAVAEIVVPHGAFALLPTRAGRAACLASARRALGPSGPLTLDLPAPDPACLAELHTPERLAWEGRLGEVPVRRTREVFRAPLRGDLRLVDRFFVGDAAPVVSELRLHVAAPDEVEWMLEANGFYVDQMWGDHAGSPVREGCDRLLVRALPLH